MKSIHANTSVFSQEFNEIYEKIDHETVLHPQLLQAYNAVYATLNRNQILSEPVHLLIVGDSGCGKTTLCDLIAQDFGTTVNEFQLGAQKNIGALMCSITPPVTPRSMAVALLRAMGIKGKIYGTSYELTERLLMELKQCDVETIFLDEGQHLYALGKRVDGGFSNNLRESLDWIKSVINKTGITFCLMGMPELVYLINADEQLARRFKNTIYLRPFPLPIHMNDAEDTIAVDSNHIGNFVDSLLKIACEFPYFDGYESFANDISKSERVFLATKGSPSRIKTLVIEAVYQAFQRKDRTISLKHFVFAFNPETKINAEVNLISRRNDQISKSMSRYFKGKSVNPFRLNTQELFSIVKQVDGA
jgi:Cdc6-like AAA superfamily ATPase